MTTPTVNSEPTVEAKRPHCICGTWLHAHENDTGKCLWPDCGCSRFQFAEDAHEPTVEEAEIRPGPAEPTVEEALAELSDMFPDERFRVEVSQRAQIDESGDIKWLESYACILQLSRGLDGFYDSPTLHESLKAVRTWHKEQS